MTPGNIYYAERLFMPKKVSSHNQDVNLYPCLKEALALD